MSGFELQASDKQLEVLADDSRFIVCNWARRVGKSFVGGIKLLDKATTLNRGDIIAVISTGYSQLRTLWLPALQETIPDEYIENINLSTMTIKLVNGVDIILRSGADEASFNSLRGLSLSYVVVDEAAFISHLQSGFEAVILPALADKRGGCLMISSPNGYNAFYDYACRGMSTEDKFKDWSYSHATFEDAFNKDEVAELAKMARATSNPITFASEWLADFAESGNSVYYGFSRDLNVRDDIDWGPECSVRNFGIDMNIGNMSCVVFRHVPGQIHIIDEVHNTSNTEELAKEIVARYPGNKLVAYPDPSARARKTSAPSGVTDLSILESHGIQVNAKSKAPSLVDAANSVNALLKNTNGEANLFIHPRCTNIIHSLERLAWKDGSASAKYSNDDYSHYADALKYAVDYEFGIARTHLKKVTIRGI